MVLIQGNNQISGATDSNGAGKSAVIDAISWCLFGATLPRGDRPGGLRGDEVACRFTKDTCEVGLKLQVNGKEKEIIRRRRPQALYLSWVKEDLSIAEKQVYIEQLLGFGWRTFSNAVVFGQGAFERFAIASNEDQLKMVDEIQGLDLRQALQRAKQYREEWHNKHWQLQEQILVLDQRRTSAESQVKELEKAHKEFAANKASRVKELERGYQGIVDEIKQLRSELAKVKGHEQWLQAAKKVLRDIDLARGDAEGLKKACELARWEHQSALRRLEEDEESIQRLIRQKKCPTCRQPAQAKLIQHGFASDLKNSRDGIAVLEKSTKQTQDKWQKQERRAQSLQQQRPDVTSERIAVAEAEVLNEKLLQTKIVSTQGRLYINEDVLHKERALVWEGEAPFRSAKKELEQVNKGLVINEQEQTKAGNTLRVADYWVEAFGDRGLRSLLFDSVADFLNERLMAHLEILTAGEASVQVSALSQTKGGKVKDRISVGAEWSWGADSYAAGSAGQDRRIDIALYCALQDLAEMRSARGFPLRVFDEAIDSIDARGREMFAHWLHQEARKRSATFVITHSQEFGDLLNPDQVWTVVMDRRGSRVEVG